jgi:hypothetical protein
MTTDDKDFLSRWSQRKQAAREGLAEPEPEAEELALPAQGAEPPAEEPPEDETAYADVDYDALDYSSDYTRFMGKDVPEMVQRRALRALWRSDPVLANIDGLNDYDEDFTDAALVVENLTTAYRAGQGYMTDEDEAEAAQAGDGRAGDSEEAASNELGETPCELARAEDAPMDAAKPHTAAAVAEDGGPPEA